VGLRLKESRAPTRKASYLRGPLTAAAAQCVEPEMVDARKGAARVPGFGLRSAQERSKAASTDVKAATVQERCAVAPSQQLSPWAQAAVYSQIYWGCTAVLLTRSTLLHRLR